MFLIVKINFWYGLPLHSTESGTIVRDSISEAIAGRHDESFSGSECGTRPIVIWGWNEYELNILLIVSIGCLSFVADFSSGSSQRTYPSSGGKLKNETVYRVKRI